MVEGVLVGTEKQFGLNLGKFEVFKHIQLKMSQHRSGHWSQTKG